MVSESYLLVSAEQMLIKIQDFPSLFEKYFPVQVITPNFKTVKAHIEMSNIVRKLRDNEINRVTRLFEEKIENIGNSEEASQRRYKLYVERDAEISVINKDFEAAGHELEVLLENLEANWRKDKIGFDTCCLFMTIFAYLYLDKLLGNKVNFLIDIFVIS